MINNIKKFEEYLNEDNSPESEINQFKIYGKDDYDRFKSEVTDFLGEEPLRSDIYISKNSYMKYSPIICFFEYGRVLSTSLSSKSIGVMDISTNSRVSNGSVDEKIIEAIELGREMNDIVSGVLSDKPEFVELLVKIISDNPRASEKLKSILNKQSSDKNFWDNRGYY